MKKQSLDINKRLKTWINNRLFIIFNSDDWIIESILYIYKDEENSNIRGRSKQGKHSSRRNS